MSGRNSQAQWSEVGTTGTEEPANGPLPPICLHLGRSLESNTSLFFIFNTHHSPSTIVTGIHSIMSWESLLNELRFTILTILLEDSDKKYRPGFPTVSRQWQDFFEPIFFRRLVIDEPDLNMLSSVTEGSKGFRTFDTSGFASSLPRTHANIVRRANPWTSFISEASILPIKPDGN